MNLPLVYQQTHQKKLTQRLGITSLAIVFIGAVVFAALHWHRH